MFQAVVDNIPQMIYWKDNALAYIDCNRSFASFIQQALPPESQNHFTFTGKQEHELPWQPDVRAYFEKIDKETLTSKQAHCNLEIKTTHQGQTCWLRTSRIPLKNQQDEVIGLLGVIENITEQKASEKALKASQEMLQLVMDNIPQAIFWKNRDYIIMGGNRNFFNDAGDGTLASVIDKTDYDLSYRVEEADFFREVDRRVMESDQPEYRIIEPQLQADGKQAWLETNKIPLHDADGNVVGILGTYEDITERKYAEEARRRELEQRVEERTRELSASNAQLKQEIEQRERIEDALRLSGQRYALATNAGQVCVWDWHSDTDQIYLAPGLNDLLGLEEHDTPTTLDDWLLLIHPEDRQLFKETLQCHLKGEIPHCENKLRMMHKNGEIRWMLSRGTIVNEELRIMGSITDITDLTHMQHAEHEQRMLAEALCDNAALLNSTLNIEEVLDRILRVIERSVPHQVANIMLVDKHTARIVRSMQSKIHKAIASRQKSHFALSEHTVLSQMQRTRKPCVLSDIHFDEPYWQLCEHKGMKSYVGTPICLQGEVIGFLNLHSHDPDCYNETHGERLQAFANQAASAIQNARSFERAQVIAALEERQRLARDLHDAVSQTLWSANITAEVLPDLWEQDINEGRKCLDDLHKFTNGALSEMRALLVELRPSGLVETRLEELLQQLTESMSNRMGFPVGLSVQGNCLLPPDTQVAFYRIAQEALNNISRHTTATSASVAFVHQAHYARLIVTDNGTGFDVSNIPSHRLGLSIMRERATSIGARLEIHSQPGQGTQIQLEWQKEIPLNA
ncbi:PAS domain-containing protein [Phototrophicus methaneseepsis]|uniref:PAS domain-containing protein n=1 Tax=Phototrophicus methaneseepsis TaxID=2710758 RepID=A0A7S8EB61_9CHLR|nr:PAS domain-containing protein [Phototrophicus methaneseepsis]QPC83726.1 PAS domain-containing protein [Phototrophicus methaneseepsis]